MHLGTAQTIREYRQASFDRAHATHPERFTRRPQAPKLPEKVWINETQPLKAQTVSLT